MPEQLIDTMDIGVWCGLDVGKEEHHACALDKGGTRLFDKPLPQDEAKLREVFTRLQMRGRVLVIVDQPNTIGALTVAVARDVGCQVAYLPGLAMRKAAQLMPGDAKTDARSAFMIATTALRMPDTLRAVDRDSEILASLKVLAGYDDDLARESTAFDQPAPVASAADPPSPGARVHRHQTDEPPLPGPAGPLWRAHGARKGRTRTCQGMGVRTKTPATILLAIGDDSAFPTAGHLATYPNIALITRHSGKSIRGEHPTRSRNKQLKNALSRPAWVASNCDPKSTAYYQHERTQEKKHNAAAICLTRRRYDITYAILKTTTLYQPQDTRKSPTTA